MVALGLGWLWMNRSNVDVLAVEWDQAGQVTLVVDSCNGAPEAILTEFVDGTYRVSVQTTQSYDAGNDCADLVKIDVDPTLESFTISDMVSGTVFQLPAVPIDPSDEIEIDGVWKMTEVNDVAVEVGINTEQIPELEIDAGFIAGNFGCNTAGGETVRDGTAMFPMLVEGNEELCTIPDGGAQMVPTERALLDLFASGFEIGQTGNEMVWTNGSNTVRFQRVAR